jgi:plasmid replication initiation protein
MESNLILGALIAIISGAIVQIVNFFIDIKKEKRKFVFEKIEDIINSISAINEGLQQDAATIFGVGPPSGSLKELSLELIKIKCIVKVYHPSLGKNIDSFNDSMNQYFTAKREFINSQRQGGTQVQLNQKIEIIKEKFELCTKEIETFIDSLTNYARL